MLYVKVVTPLVLKWWVWPMIKCSHLTPKSIYSYIDDLVNGNFLIDARIGCACFDTYFICYLIVWACWLHNFFIRGHPFVVLIVLVFVGQVDVQECLRTSSSYICSSCLKLFSCYITKNEQVFFGPSAWGALGATDPSKADLQNLLHAFRSDQHIQTRSNRNHLDWSRLSSRCLLLLELALVFSLKRKGWSNKVEIKYLPQLRTKL